MFRYPAWAVGSYRSGPPASKTIGTKSTGGCYQRVRSPCILREATALEAMNKIRLNGTIPRSVVPNRLEIRVANLQREKYKLSTFIITESPRRSKPTFVLKVSAIYVFLSQDVKTRTPQIVYGYHLHQTTSAYLINFVTDPRRNSSSVSQQLWS